MRDKDCTLDYLHDSQAKKIQAMRVLLERWMKVWREATTIQQHSVDWIQKHDFSKVSADTETFLGKAK